MQRNGFGLSARLSLALVQERPRGVRGHSLQALVGSGGCVEVWRICGLAGRRAARKTVLRRVFEPWMPEGCSRRVRPGLRHLPSGRPQIVLPRSLRNRLVPQCPQIAISHDGGILAAALGCGAGLRGVGVDVVDLERLRSRISTRREWERFLGHITDASVLQKRLSLPASSLEGMRAEAAVRFALMEAVSKAFGTGWTLGSDARRGVPCKSIRIQGLRPSPRIELAHPASCIMKQMGGRRVVAQWTRTGDVVVAVAAVLRK